LNGLHFLYTGEIKENLNLNELIELLDFSGYFYLQNLKNMIYISIAKHSDELLKSDSFLKLDEDVLMTILFSETFPVDDEYQLLTRIIEWGEMNPKKDLNLLFEGIRFTRIKTNLLVEIEKKIPKKYLIQTYKALIKKEIERPRGGVLKVFPWNYSFDSLSIYLILMRMELCTILERMNINMNGGTLR
jgi:hypothetical protein